MKEVIDCGCARIFTSGCRPCVDEGIDELQKIVAQAGTRITILAGGGVTPNNVKHLIRETGVQEVHASCKHTMPGGYNETDSAIVKELIAQITL